MKLMEGQNVMENREKKIVSYTLVTFGEISFKRDFIDYDFVQKAIDLGKGTFLWRIINYMCACKFVAFLYHRKIKVYDSTKDQCKLANAIY